jgi:hypothetical protein
MPCAMPRFHCQQEAIDWVEHSFSGANCPPYEEGL